MPSRLSGRTILITGASEGVGAALAQAASQRGARLVLMDQKPLQWQAPSGSLFVTGDITSEHDRQRVWAAADAAFGQVDVLINNAGVGLYAPSWRSDPAAARRLLDVNYSSAVDLARMAAERMVPRRDGTIVNIISVGAFAALPWATLYCASKTALMSFSEGITRELRGTGVRVVSVFPGIVRTNFRDHVLQGLTPPKVKDISRVIAPELLARRTFDAVEARRSMCVYVPRIGYVFWMSNLFLRPVFDLWIDSLWREMRPGQ